MRTTTPRRAIHTLPSAAALCVSRFLSEVDDRVWEAFEAADGNAADAEDGTAVGEEDGGDVVDELDDEGPASLCTTRVHASETSSVLAALLPLALAPELAPPLEAGCGKRERCTEMVCLRAAWKVAYWCSQSSSALTHSALSGASLRWLIGSVV
jgi:hypothetical protein